MTCLSLTWDLWTVAARCTNTTPEEALRLAVLGGQAALIPLVLLALALTVAVARR